MKGFSLIDSTEDRITRAEFGMITTASARITFWMLDPSAATIASASTSIGKAISMSITRCTA